MIYDWKFKNSFQRIYVDSFFLSYLVCLLIIPLFIWRTYDLPWHLFWFQVDVLFCLGFSCHYYTKRIPLHWAQQEKEGDNNDIGENYCLKAERMHAGQWIRNPERWSQLWQQLLPVIHEIILGDLKALCSFDSVSVFLPQSTCYMTSKWVPWLDPSLTLIMVSSCHPLKTSVSG